MSSSFYFTSRGNGSTSEYDAIPKGAQLADFYSRPVAGYADIYQTTTHSDSNHSNTTQNQTNNDNDSYYNMEQNNVKVAPQIPGSDPPIGSLLLPRSVPTKVDPKAMFAAERTFMQWMHSSLWLLSASLMIMTYSGGLLGSEFGDEDPIKFLFGCLIMPAALSFTFYSWYQCKWKTSENIEKKEYDGNGTVLIILSIECVYTCCLWNDVYF